MDPPYRVHASWVKGDIHTPDQGPSIYNHSLSLMHVSTTMLYAFWRGLLPRGPGESSQRPNPSVAAAPQRSRLVRLHPLAASLLTWILRGPPSLEVYMSLFSLIYVQ